MSVTFRPSLLIAIGVGGAIGASLRYSISIMFYYDGFPLTTLIVNWLGCFLLALFANHKYLNKRVSPTTLIGLNTGLIGSFTTFSTVTVETITVFNSSVGLGLLYIFLNFFGGLLLCLLGFKIAIRGAEA